VGTAILIAIAALLAAVPLLARGRQRRAAHLR
jgi:hypothetical protein